jgi:hypothetical protein
MGFINNMKIDYIKNHHDQIKYNPDGFCTPTNTLIIYLIDSLHPHNNDDEYNDPDDGYNEPYEPEASPAEEACLSITFLSNSSQLPMSEYTYNLQLSLDDGYGIFTAYGQVKIYCSTDEQNNKYIADVLVNGVSNGPLHDKYNDCFDIYPYEYLPFLCPNIPCNFPFRPDFTDVLDEDE